MESLKVLREYENTQQKNAIWTNKQHQTLNLIFHLCVHDNQRTQDVSNNFLFLPRHPISRSIWDSIHKSLFLYPSRSLPPSCVYGVRPHMTSDIWSTRRPLRSLERQAVCLIRYRSSLCDRFLFLTQYYTLPLPFHDDLFPRGEHVILWSNITWLATFNVTRGHATFVVSSTAVLNWGRVQFSHFGLTFFCCRKEIRAKKSVLLGWLL